MQWHVAKIELLVSTTDPHNPCFDKWPNLCKKVNYFLKKNDQSSRQGKIHYCSLKKGDIVCRQIQNYARREYDKTCKVMICLANLRIERLS